MPTYREEEEFAIRIDLSAEFPPEYEGEEDGRAWLEAWEKKLRPELVRAVFDVLRSHPRFDAVPVSRGSSPERMLDIAVRYRLREAPREEVRRPLGLPILPKKD